jgi:hypothetical protein
MLEPSVEKPARKGDVQLAQQIHEAAWLDVLEKAKMQKDFKNGIYASRVIAVKHPELYLKADNCFLQAISSNPGFQKVYFTKDIHSPELFWKRQLEMTGPPFSFDDVNFSDLRVVNNRDLYPNEFPFLPFLDRRLLPVASTLKTYEKEVTDFEKAVLFYFKLKRNGSTGAFIVYCDNESAYVYYDDHLVRCNDLNEVAEIPGAPILIFNEEYVWYPLMRRDDSTKSPSLNEIVSTFAVERNRPQLESHEEEFVNKLHEVTNIESKRAEGFATLASMRSTGVVLDNFQALWDRVLPTEDYRLGQSYAIIKQFLMKANLLSPVSAYLAAKAIPDSGCQRLWTLSREWIGRTATKNWPKTRDHLWWCSHLEYSIDETFRTRAGHCVTQSCNLSSVLTLAGIDHYVLEAGKIRDSETHHYIFVPGVDAIIDDGRIVSSQNTVLYPRETITGGFLNVIIYLNHEGRWANLIGNNYSGNISPVEAVKEAMNLAGINDDALGYLAPIRLPVKSKTDVVGEQLEAVHVSQDFERLKEEQWKPIDFR